VPPLQVLGPELVAWSQLQQPRPVPQPLSGRTLDRNAQPLQDAAIQDSRGELPTQQPDSVVRDFRGLIAVIDGRRLLKLASDVVVQIEDPEMAKQYEGRRVKITGTGDESGKLIVMSIELDS
jgi:hypothetical protein